jgi:hypothetical protein
MKNTFELDAELIEAQIEFYKAQASYWRALAAQTSGTTYLGHVPETAV